MTGDKKMGVFENVLDKLGFEVVREPEDGEAPEKAAAEPEEEPKPRRPKRQPAAAETPAVQAEARVQQPRSNGVVNGDVYGIKATVRSDAKIVCDKLRAGLIVVVDVTAMDTGETTRLFDFIQGSVYALDGVITQFNENVIIVAPQGKDVQTYDAVADDEADENYDYSYVDDDDEVEYGY